MTDDQIYIAKFDMRIKPAWDKVERYVDSVSWNKAIEAVTDIVTNQRLAHEIRKLKK